MKISCIVLFSGGLDSVVAAHLLKSQGCDVRALHFVLPFDSGIGKEHARVRDYADRLGIPLHVIEEGEEFLPVVRNPEFGFGKNVNPCIDCRIYRLKRAAAIMKETGAHFIATGEVVGQRPMSQHLNALRAIEKRAGLRGLLVRPLSAQILEPTVPEMNGWIDRKMLLGIQGRSRKEQLEYAARFQLLHSTPAGGCILTHGESAARYRDLAGNKPDFTIDDFKMIAYGRRFRVTPSAVLTVGRNAGENGILEKLCRTGDYHLATADIPGPSAVVQGNADNEIIRLCCSIVARYSRARGEASVGIAVAHEGVRLIETVTPFADEKCRKFMV